MKKILIASLATLAFAASAADFVSVDVDHVTDRANGKKSVAEYVRAGKEIGGVQYGLQSRTARYSDGSGMYNSLELTAGKNMGVAGLNVTPFAGVGYDNGKNGAVNGTYTYGLVGLNAGKAIGPGYALAGIKTRLNGDHANPKQTVTFVGYSVPVTKNVSVGASVSRSAQDIKERAFGVGISVGF
jgi:hypothetical protein